jgi:anti-anti-sigma factor
MTMNQLKASVRLRPGLTIIDLSGDIDGGADDILEAAYARAESQEPAAILLNFAGVEYINSKGIALLVVLLARAVKSNRRLLACGLTNHYREIFEITRLSDYIKICADEETALAKMQSYDPAIQISPGWRRVEALGSQEGG